MLSGPTLDLAFALRECVGAGVQGDGPDLASLRKFVTMSDADLEAGLRELESVSFVHLDRVPNEAVGLGEVATVIVLAPLQIYLDDLEGQGTDDL